MLVSCEVREVAGRQVLHVTGEIDYASSPDLEKTVLEYLEKDADRVILDLSEVSFMDSSGLALLLHARKAAADRGGSLSVVIPPTGPVMRVVEVAGVRSHLDLYESLDDAVSA